ncbi:hypothetical protein AQJ91_42550 [Streptomyces dysideae]|uniref:Uncharacterized protein n=1 Tax=Streptomyces dysideae TaxID=909626 RepID=A0A101UR22_9ACTN|nr:hypothetical protein AQJ91_42550 [Streptomyces dysideae]
MVGMWGGGQEQTAEASLSPGPVSTVQRPPPGVLMPVGEVGAPVGQVGSDDLQPLVVCQSAGWPRCS